jgi:hypothetical protein
MDRISAIENLRVASRLMSPKFRKVAIGATIAISTTVIISGVLVPISPFFLYAYGALLFIFMSILLITVFFVATKYIHLIRKAFKNSETEGKNLYYRYLLQISIASIGAGISLLLAIATLVTVFALVGLNKEDKPEYFRVYSIIMRSLELALLCFVLTMVAKHSPSRKGSSIETDSRTEMNSSSGRENSLYNKRTSLP